jgi:hypothetical protein
LFSGVVYFTHDPGAMLPGKILRNAIETDLPRTVCLAFLKMAAEVAIPVAYENVETCQRMTELACDDEYEFVVRELSLIAWESPSLTAILGLFVNDGSVTQNAACTRWYGVTLVRPIADIPVGAVLSCASLDGFLLTFSVGAFSLAVVDVRTLSAS